MTFGVYTEYRSTTHLHREQRKQKHKPHKIYNTQQVYTPYHTKHRCRVVHVIYFTIQMDVSFWFFVQILTTMSIQTTNTNTKPKIHQIIACYVLRTLRALRYSGLGFTGITTSQFTYSTTKHICSNNKITLHTLFRFAFKD